MQHLGKPCRTLRLSDVARGEGTKSLVCPVDTLENPKGIELLRVLVGLSIAHLVGFWSDLKAVRRALALLWLGHTWQKPGRLEEDTVARYVYRKSLVFIVLRMAFAQHPPPPLPSRSASLEVDFLGRCAVMSSSWPFFPLASLIRLRWCSWVFNLFA